jgi:hypothetical protein
MKMSSFFLPSCTSNGAPVEWNWQGKTDNSEKNLSQCHFVHHKSHMDLTWDRTRASVVRSRRLTAWAMARPTSTFSSRVRLTAQGVFCLISLSVAFLMRLPAHFRFRQSTHVCQSWNLCPQIFVRRAQSDIYKNLKEFDSFLHITKTSRHCLRIRVDKSAIWLRSLVISAEALALSGKVPAFHLYHN